jgi:flagellar biosynthesis protein
MSDKPDAETTQNPTKSAVPLAVALVSGGPDGNGAPTVVATGRGKVAEQILELAFAHGVKVRTDPDLVQILAAVDVDTVIPAEAFVAVAEILAYVYRANGLIPPPDLGVGWANGQVPPPDMGAGWESDR